MDKKAVLYPILLLLVLSIVVVVDVDYALKDTGSKQKYVLEKQEELKLSLIKQGRYKCCIEKPCTYCLEHTDKEIVCDCIDDIMEGKSPCGECIGEILEGNANHLLSKEQLVNSLVNELEDEEAVRKIIDKKYPSN